MSPLSDSLPMTGEPAPHSLSGGSGSRHFYPGQHVVPRPWGGTWQGPTDLEDEQDSFGYGKIHSRPPYGRWTGIRPGPGHHPEPLYYQPTDPFSLYPNASLMNYSDPYHNAAYLPRTQGYDASENPGFGYIPANYVHPDDHPFNFRGRFFHPAYTDLHNNGSYVSSSGPAHIPHGFKGVIPFQVPIPGYHANLVDSSEDYKGPTGVYGFKSNTYHAASHPIYAPWYMPGVKPGDDVHKDRFAFPKPLRSHKVARPRWFDDPQSWPHYDSDKYSSFIIRRKAPPPPPVAPGEGEEGSAF
eukprot:g2999.t1